MSKVFFIFSHYEYINIKNLVTKNDFIVSVSFIDGVGYKCKKYIILDSWESEEITLESFYNFFNPFLKIDKDIWAFSNNFYETNFEYHLKLKKIISIHDIKEFIFYQKTSSYSLFGTNKLVGAEYETQKQFLYNRNSSFQNTIRKIIGKENVKYFLKKRKITFDFIFNILRFFSIFGYEMYRILKSNSNISKSYNNNSSSKYIYIFRSSLSYEFAKFRNYTDHEDVCYFNSISTQSLKNSNNFRTKYSLNLTDLLRVLFTFVVNFVKLIFSNTTYEGVKYKQSLLESQIMSLQPKLYYLTLKRILKKSDKNSIMFNFEVKSPYAYFDQKLSDSFQKKLITLLYFDLIKKKLPEFFYSKFLHVNTDKLKLKLDPCIDNSKEILNFYNLQESYDYSKSNSKPITNFCLFLDCTSFTENELLINFLIENEYDFCIRKHPRDSWDYDKKFQKYFISRSIRNIEFFKIFKYGISGASAIIQNLIDNNKPFYLVVNKGFGFTKSMHYYYETYYGNINSLNDIISKSDLVALQDSFKLVYYNKPITLNMNDFYDQINLKLSNE